MQAANKKAQGEKNDAQFRISVWKLWNFLLCQFDMEELSDQALDRMYVEENVLTNTDRFLEDHVTGSLRVWHLVLIVAGGVLVASKKLYLYKFSDGLC